ncbi:hypothetical protein [Rheinheimera sp.]|uniref:hypothetical protein n=1 Tax=Rheinheimera sp. TaxID=1869214 RepID=UPI004048CDDC
MADNKAFCEQIGSALVTLGTKETLSCMARMMAAIAHKQGADLEFDCDIGTVTVERKTVQLNG